MKLDRFRHGGRRFECLEVRTVFASISGSVWVEQNGSSGIDAADRPVKSALVWIDANSNGAIDAGEPQTHAGADGKYAFTGLSAGDYEIRMQPTPGLFQTYPSQYFAFHRDSDTQLFGLAEIDSENGIVTHLTPAVSGLRHGLIKTIQDEFYGAGRSTDRLFRIDPVTGTQVLIGNTGKQLAAGLAYDPVADKIYTLARDVDEDPVPWRFYEINRQTAELTPVGSGERVHGVFGITALTFDQVNREIVLFDNYLDEIVAYDLHGNSRKVLKFDSPTVFYNLSFDGHRLLTFQPDDQNVTTLYEIDTANHKLVPLHALDNSLAVDSADILGSNQAHRVELQTNSTSVSGLDFLTNAMNILDGALQIDDAGVHLTSKAKGLDIRFPLVDAMAPLRFCVGAQSSELTIVQSLAATRPIEIQTSPLDDRVNIDAIPLIKLNMGSGVDTLAPTAAMELRLPQLLDKLRGVDAIDLRGSAAVTLFSDAASIAAITDAKKLTVHSSPEDTVDLSAAPWTVKAPSAANGSRLHQLAVDDVILELDDSLGWKNPLLSADVNRDGSVSALDALVVINLLNTLGSQQLTTSNATAAEADYVDTSGDNYLSPLDALLVINRLNQNA